MMDYGTKSLFFPEGIVNKKNLHKRLWNCHSHYLNDQNIQSFLEGFAFISCKYLHFICFVENL